MQSSMHRHAQQAALAVQASLEEDGFQSVRWSVDDDAPASDNAAGATARMVFNHGQGSAARLAVAVQVRAIEVEDGAHLDTVELNRETF